MYRGPNTTLVTGHYTGPIETGDVKEIPDELAIDMVVYAEDEDKEKRVLLTQWDDATPDDIAAYAARVKAAEAAEAKQAKADKTGIAKATIKKEAASS